MNSANQSQIRITMAAIDPTEEPEADEDGNVPAVPRATLKILKGRMSGDDDEDDSYLDGLLNGEYSDEDDEEDSDDETNGGPSDPAKSKKARQEAAIMKLIAAAQKDEDSDEEMEEGTANGTKSKKGKEKASDEDDDEDSEESDDEDEAGLEEFVVCTLDTERVSLPPTECCDPLDDATDIFPQNYQQPLDITIGEDERVYFIVSGTHTIHLTGNYVVDPNEEEDEDDEDDDEYDLPPGMEDVLDGDDSDLSDELDELADMERVKEIDTDEEEAPKLVKADKKADKADKKGKKRSAEDAAENLDDLIAKDETKLSKKQQKKLKNNKGEAVAAEEKKDAAKDSTPKSDKKVQFAKNLEQGPTGSAEKAKTADKKAAGVKVVNGVTIDDRKLGSGRTAKNGDKVSMRYIGKLTNGKVFDSNKKGTPFSFKIGKGEVIKGWDIGIAGMSVGGERRLTIPPHLAYGSRSMPEIPANSTLVFDVKLLEIK